MPDSAHLQTLVPKGRGVQFIAELLISICHMQDSNCENHKIKPHENIVLYIWSIGSLYIYIYM